MRFGGVHRPAHAVMAIRTCGRGDQKPVQPPDGGMGELAFKPGFGVYPALL